MYNISIDLQLQNYDQSNIINKKENILDEFDNSDDFENNAEFRFTKDLFIIDIENLSEKIKDNSKSEIKADLFITNIDFNLAENSCKSGNINKDFEFKNIFNKNIKYINGIFNTGSFYKNNDNNNNSLYKNSYTKIVLKSGF